MKEPFEINIVEVKVKFDECMKVCNRDQGNIVNDNCWIHFFFKIKLRINSM